VGENGLLHGTVILKQLVEPWAFSDHTICADSYFASVSAALHLKRIGLRFIGVIKTATRQYPMPYLSRVELHTRGDRYGVVTRFSENGTRLLAFVWMDRDRRYFISSTSSLEAGMTYVRDRWRQLDETPNAEPSRVTLTVLQPKASEIYYNTCGRIDQHNRHRADTLTLEKKFRVHNWDMRVNMTILGMIIVDTWLVYRGCTETVEKQKDFYLSLAEELIDNTYDSSRPSLRNAGANNNNNNNNESPTLDWATGAARCGVYAHLTPTKRFRRDKHGVPTRNRYQSRCSSCKKLKTIHLCSMCLDESPSKSLWVCHTKKGSMCFAKHMTECHGM
jgi:hypothetical protein